ncbi:Peptidyl-tRNA hydrolase [invertebrate metagenome]|uniref:Peptidyl-tRNA hydrolase n=1 Tax=invertebrate metagenome TaxID=1711999 RepID=A0A484H5Q7_9ZZZZ
MFLMVGLGNPGPDYAGHRHNIGFMAVDTIVHRHTFGPFRATRCQAQIAQGTVAGTVVLALKPLTYMNNSGQAVSGVVRSLKIPLDRMVVFHDELDLPPGRVRVKRGGGHAGHNGLQSIDAHLDRDYQRVRMGIGHPGQRNRVVGYVLHDFSKTDHLWLKPLLGAIADRLPILLSGDTANFAACLGGRQYSHENDLLSS